MDRVGYVKEPQRPQTSALPSLSAIPLDHDLWFEPYRCALVRQGQIIPLTVRELVILDVLLHPPCCYQSACTLAGQLSLPNRPPVDHHSLEQTISELRRKLGETQRRPRLLLSRRQIGYVIFPCMPIPTAIPHPPALLGIPER